MSARDFLRAALEERMKRNPKFSLRSFARQLGLSHSSLSQVIHGKKNLSQEMASRISKKLGLAPKEEAYFTLLAQKDATTDAGQREHLHESAKELNPSRQVQNLELEAFRVISEWYHFAILQMTDLPASRFKPHLISRSLGIQVSEAEKAITRLETLGLLIQKSPGCYERTHSSVLAQAQGPSGDANAALRRFHQQMLERARRALETQASDDRYIGSETFALDPELIPQFKSLMNEFLDQAAKLASKSKKPTAVYHLGSQLFAVTSKLAAQGAKS